MHSDECAEATCAEALEELYSYLDGELDDQRRTIIHDHLEACGPCLDAFDFEDDLRKVIAQRCRDEVPEPLRNRIAALIEGA